MKYRRVEVNGVRTIALPGKSPEKSEDRNPKSERSQELPSKARMAKNFAGALVANTANWLKTGSWMRTDEQAAALHQVCEGCTEWYRPEQDRCGHPKCGCRLGTGDLVSKTRWLTTRCPVGKWDAVISNQ